MPATEPKRAQRVSADALWRTPAISPSTYRSAILFTPYTVRK